MAGLRSEDAALRKLVLDQFKELSAGDLGYGGLSGKLPATWEEIFAAIMPLLQDLAVRSKVALAYLKSGRDDGAFEVLADSLFVVGIPNEKRNPSWLDALNRACGALKTCAATTQDPDVRMRAGLLALRVIHQTLRARRAQGRFPGWREERLPIDVLLQTIALTRPAGAQEILLREAIESPDEHMDLRSLVLLSYVDLSGEVPACAPVIVAAVVAESDVAPLDKRLEQFAARKMIGLPALLAAARNPDWCYMAVKVIGAWPRGNEAGFIVDGLILALEVMAPRAPAVEDGLLEVNELLRLLLQPR